MKRLAALLGSLLLAGFLGATLVRLAPGFGVDEAEIDPRVSSEAIAYLREMNAPKDSLVGYYAKYLLSLGTGDLGMSRSLGQPVKDLIRERFPVTLRSIAMGLGLAWATGLAAAALVAACHSEALDFVLSICAGGFLCLPAAFLALLFLYFNAGPGVAIAAVLFPKVYRYGRNILRKAASQPHVSVARAKGVGRGRLLIWHVIAPSFAELFTLAALTVNVALTASIPIEALCESPGIGQLAWTAALGRDLPLLVVLTLIVASVTMVCNYLSELAVRFSVPVKS